MNILEYESYHEDKVHSDPSFPYNTYLCSIPLDFLSVPMHWHDEMELIFIKKGEGQVLVDFRTYHVKSNTIILILPGQLHAIAQFEDQHMEYENIIFDPMMLLSKKSDNCNLQYLIPMIEGKISVSTCFSEDHPHYHEITAPIEACDKINAEKPSGYELFIKSQLYLFFYTLHQYCRSTSQGRAADKSYDKLKLVLKHIENHYMEKITIDEIAKVAGFSTSHFMRYFKETMGTTFVNYLNDYRLTIASRLLIASNSSILAIADESGFENVSYFNRVFKLKYGLTPSRYRKEKNIAAKQCSEVGGEIPS